MVVLDKVFRQKDPKFLGILHQIRRGVVSAECNRILADKVKESRMSGRDMGRVGQLGSNIQHTKLFSRNKDVDAYNAEALRGLPESASQSFAARDEGPDHYLHQLKSGTKAPETLELKIGSQVRVRWRRLGSVWVLWKWFWVGYGWVV